MKNKIIIITLGLVLIYFVVWAVKNNNWNSKHKVGDVLDQYNNVKVYYNGGVDNNSGRNLAKDGYNIGIKYQCVEFVKRYYYEHLNHKMPDSYGHAKDFFDTTIANGQMNVKRNLIQYTNPSSAKPSEDDILIFKSTLFNFYGHVAIVTNVSENDIELIQQNAGPFSSTRERIKLIKKDNLWFIDNSRILGRLGKK